MCRRVPVLKSAFKEDGNTFLIFWPDINLWNIWKESCECLQDCTLIVHLLDLNIYEMAMVRFLQAEGMSQSDIHHGLFSVYSLWRWHNFYPCSASMFLWIIIQCCSAIFKIVAQHRHLLSAKKRSSRKHSLACDESRSDLLQLEKIWPLFWPQTWNNILSHRSFCLLIKPRHMTGEHWH
jgi:hypothetical protein